MISSRRLGREAALQALYLADACQLTLENIPNAAWSDQTLAPATREFARHLADGVLSERSRIDALLSRYAENWELGRMAVIDRCILRISTFEFLRDLETPINVIINEAVDIAKKYSTAESGKFVNGILDKLKEE